MTLTATDITPVFSHDIFALQAIGGVNRYFCELHSALRRAGVRSTVIAPAYVCGLLPGADRVVGIHVPAALQVRGARRISKTIGRLTERPTLALVGARAPGLVFHRTYYSSVRPTTKHATAITVYDMIHERHPGTFGPKDSASRLKALWCDRADVVFAISEYTKRELVDLLDVPPDRVVVSHLGVTWVAPDQETQERLSRSEPFFLYVGRRSGYKNFARLVEAFAATRAAQEGIRLIAFGGGKPAPDELRCLAEHGVAGFVSFTAGDDTKLAAHYATATALLYPSLDEGFGIPPLEAMLHGCPVAAANAGAIPEVVGDHALLFDPTDRKAMTDAIDRIATDGALRTRLAARGAAHAGSFTWDAAAATTMTAYAAAVERAEARG